MLWYLAHPYSGGVEKNMASVNAIAAKLFDANITFYSPLSMTHPIHVVRTHSVGYDGDGTDWEKWLNFDQVIIERCDGLFLCPGWETSKGCRKEFDYFFASDKPIYTIDTKGRIEHLYNQMTDLRFRRVV
jgi:hypothetical protein